MSATLVSSRTYKPGVVPLIDFDPVATWWNEGRSLDSREYLMQRAVSHLNGLAYQEWTRGLMHAILYGWRLPEQAESLARICEISAAQESLTLAFRVGLTGHPGGTMGDK